jgi:hypothetical protein
MDRWNIAIMYSGKEGPCYLQPDVYAVDDKGPCLKGELDMAVVTAACLGEVHYFASKRLYGMPIRVEGPHGCNFQFWWLFADFFYPETGHSRPIGWCQTAGFMAAMRISEYAQATLRQLREAYVYEHPEAKAWTDDNWLDWNLETFKASALGEAVEHEDDLHRDDDNSRAYLFTFQDSSLLRLDRLGWRCFDKSIHVVPMLPTRPGQAFMPREVQSVFTEDGRAWRQ